MSVKNLGKKWQMTQNFCRNHSISQRFRDKCIFTLYAKFKMAACGKILPDKKFCRNFSISHHFQDKYVFSFYVEIQYGCQKCRENNFWQNVAYDSAYTPGVKNFVEITISHSVSEINAFFGFTQKFKMATKMAGKQFYEKIARRLCGYSGVKNCSIFHTISETLKSFHLIVKKNCFI